MCKLSITVDGWVEELGTARREEVCKVHECVCEQGLINILRLPQHWPISRFLSTPHPAPKTLKLCLTCPASQSSDKMLTPNIRYDDSYISSALGLGFVFTAVIRELKRAGWACIEFQERDISPGFFLRWKEQRAGEVEGRGWQIPLTSKDTSADPSSVSSLFVCIWEEALWTTHASSNAVQLK